MAVAVSSAAPAAVQFTGSYTVNANASDPGLVIQTQALLNPSSSTTGSLAFALDVGESYIVDLFRIWTDEVDVGSDDTVQKPISVGFTFSTPASAGSVPGATVGGNIFIAQWGEVNWIDPKVIDFGNGGMLQVFLSDETFNGGAFGLAEGKKHGDNVTAKFKLIKDSVSVVPLPATLPLFLVALGGLALLRRRKSAAA